MPTLTLSNIICKFSAIPIKISVTFIFGGTWKIDCKIYMEEPWTIKSHNILKDEQDGRLVLKLN